MVNLKIKDAEAMSVDELNSKLVELRKEMMKDMTQIKTGTVPKNPGQVSMNKKIIARILTILKKKKEGKKPAKEQNQKTEKKAENAHEKKQEKIEKRETKSDKK